MSSAGYFTTPRWDKAASLRSRFNSASSAQRTQRCCAGVLRESDPPPARPVGELPGGHRDGFGELRQPPLVRTELLRVRLPIGQAATQQELADESGKNCAAASAG